MGTGARNMMDKEFGAQSSLFPEKDHGTKGLKEKRSVGGHKLVMVNRNDKERSENKQNKRNGDDW